MSMVLVVDDEPAIRRLLSSLLRSAGMEVELAATGREALDKLGQGEPDAIILDLMMPEMSGREFLEAARRRGCFAPAIVLSAYDAARVGKEIEAAAAVPKPFDPDLLLQTLQAVLARSPKDQSVNGTRIARTFSSE
jgi:CheY-like chemotaxis protein